MAGIVTGPKPCFNVCLWLSVLNGASDKNPFAFQKERTSPSRIQL